MSPWRHRLHFASQFIAFGVAYYAIAAVTFRFGFLEASAIVWPSIGVATAVVLLRGWRYLPAFALAHSILLFTREERLWHIVTGTLADMLGTAVCVAIFRTRKAHLSLDRMEGILTLIGAACVASLVAATVGYGSYASLNGVSFLQLGPATEYAGWLLSDVLGIVLMMPLIGLRPKRTQPVPAWRAAEMIGLALAVLGCVGLSHSLFGFANFAILPLIIWAGLRFGAEGAAGATLALALGFIVYIKPDAANVFTFQPRGGDQLTMTIQAGLLSVAITSLIVSTLANAEALRQAALGATEAKNLFVANLSHEVRDPLGAIAGFSALGAELQAQPQETTTAFGTINREANRALRLIADSLDIAKLEAGRLPMESTTFSLPALLEQLRGYGEARTRASGLQFALICGQNLPPRLVGDPRRLAQALRSLIAEAAHRTQSGMIRFFIDRAAAEWAEQRTDTDATARLSFVVESDGELRQRNGDKSHMANLGASHSCVNAEASESTLGLKLAAELAHRMRGEITISASDEVNLSRFIFTARLGIPSTEDEKSATETAKLEASRRRAVLKGAHILVADDSEDSRHLTARALSAEGAVVESVTNGRSVLAAFSGRKFDIVALDINMPGLSGLETVRLLRTAGHLGIVVALTGDDSEEMRESCVRAGFDAHITKPIEPKEFGMVLAHLLQSQTSSAFAKRSQGST